MTDTPKPVLSIGKLDLKDVDVLPRLFSRRVLTTQVNYFLMSLRVGKTLSTTLLK